MTRDAVDFLCCIATLNLGASSLGFLSGSIYAEGNCELFILNLSAGGGESPETISWFPGGGGGKWEFCSASKLGAGGGLLISFDVWDAFESVVLPKLALAFAILFRFPRSFRLPVLVVPVP